MKATKFIALIILCFVFGKKVNAQCGLDVYIAVDQSGSIDAVENAQGREFISQLMRQLDPWGTANDQSRMAIAQWSSTGEWAQYAFPFAGINYTTKLDDVLAYQNSPRIYGGGTDPYQALLKSYQAINQTPISGRTTPKLLILMTDAYCDQIQSNITSLATQIKADGIYVMVLAIDAAQGCTILQGENVADAGGYFSATSYAELQFKALDYVKNIINAGCANFTPKFDLNITLNSYAVTNCVGNTGTYKVDYSINNIGNLAWSNPITISFYDGDPTLSPSRYITKQSLSTQNIIAQGNIVGSFTSPLLIPYSKVYAIVNFDGNLLANAPPLPTNLKDKLLIVGERRGSNNISNGITRTNDVSCIPFDLSISLNNYTATNCLGNTGTFKVDYTISNAGRIWNNLINISFYDGNPTLSTTKFITKQSLSTQNIAAGGNIIGSFTSVLLGTSSQLYAIVNFDGSLLSNAPPLPLNLIDKLTIIGEGNGSNNVSNGIKRTNDLSCTPKPIIQVSATSMNMVCNNVNYEVEICNTGDATAFIDSLIPIKPHNNFTLKNQTTISDSTARRIWGTYYGGNIYNEVNPICTDAQGNIYMAGTTINDGSIPTFGSHQSTFGGGISDAFLVKFNSEGVRQWGTYFGGSDRDVAMAISTDVQGNIYMVGTTTSTNAIATVGSHQPTFVGLGKAFLVKFNSDGVRQWGTYYGGSDYDDGTCISTDKIGNVFIGGIALSSNGISTPGSHQVTFGGSADAFLVKFNSDGVREWGTYFGGYKSEYSSDICTDLQGNVYLSGQTRSSNAIATVGSHQSSYGGGFEDVFLVKFNSEGARQWGTYYGGSDFEQGSTISSDGLGNVYMAGTTESTNAIATAGSHQEVSGGRKDGFLVKFNSAGLRQWGTYYGGIINDNVTGIRTDAQGNLYMVGYTTSTNAIATFGSHQSTFNGSQKAFLAKFNRAGIRQWGTYYGGSIGESAYDIDIDARGNIYMAGSTRSLDSIATLGSHQEIYSGVGDDGDAFLVKFKNSGITLAPGECKTIQYTYTYTNVPPGTYNFSVGIATSQTPILILPDSNFTAGGIANLDGFNGAVHTSDNITITGNTPACPAGDQVKVAVSIPAVSGCGSGNYAQATVTITNTSGIKILNPSLYLNLTGSGSKFGGELYNLTNNLKIPAPNILSPSYPNVPYSLYGKSGEQRLPIWELPAGTSTFQVDIDLGTSLTNLAVRIDTIPTTFNDSGKTNLATDAQGVSIPALPTISGFNCPSSITAGGNITFSGISTTNTTSLKWASSTQANIPNGGTLSNPSLVYTPSGLDLANGYVAISLTVYNSAGCEVTRSCQIAINSVLVDYGDAPITYDLNKNTKPIAGNATLLTGIYLGSTAPSTETIAKNTTTALGDGVEEDGLIVATCGARPANGINYPLTVSGTNNTTTKAFVNAFADWNNDGDYLDEGETAIKLVEAPISSGTKNYILNFKPIAPNTTISQYFVRLRISTDSNSIKQPYETAPSGEVEDHLMKTGQILSQTSYTICQGDTIKINGENYSVAGTFSDTLRSSGGCDSIITLIIKVNPKYVRTQNVSICPGKSYTIGTHTYTQAGTYKDTLKTIANCDSIITTVLSISTAPSAPVVSITQPTCTVPTGTITITAVSGNTFSFDGGAYSATLVYSGLAPNSNHTIKAKNASGCESTITNASIGTAPTAPSAPVVSITQPTCTVPTGTITITAVSGNTYSFDGGAYSATLVYSGLAPNSNHTIKAKNASACESTITNASIGTAPTAPSAPVVSITQPTCTVPTGTITITAVSGNTFSFDGGAYSATLIYSGLAPNSNHTIKAKNASDCESTITNASIGTAPTAPSAPVVSITQPTCTVPTGTITITAVSGNTFSFDGGAYSATLIYSGLAPNSNHTIKAKNASACESTITNASIGTAPTAPSAPVVSITQPTCTVPTGTITITAVSGNTFSFDGGAYSATLVYSGLAPNSNHTIKAKNVSACESTITNASIGTAPTAPSAPVVSITQPTCTLPTGTITITAVSGNTFSFDGGAYSATLVYSGLAPNSNHTIKAKNASACESTITNASINRAPQASTPVSQNVSICPNGSYTIGSNTYTQAGTYKDTLRTINNCDSVVTTTIIVTAYQSISRVYTICNGSSIMVGTNTYTQSGNYTDTLSGLGGCDTIQKTQLTVNPTFIKTNKNNICQGENIVVGNNIYGQTGIYRDTLKTRKGCDSIIISDLTVNPSYSKNQSINLCEGESIQIGNNIYNQTGIYRDTFKTIYGCDSIFISDIKIRSKYIKNIVAEICPNGSYTVGNQTYTQAGNYIDTLQTIIYGCDSIINLNLSVKDTITNNLSSNICEGDSIQVGNNFYHETGIYSTLIKTINGCDSVVVLNLIVKPLAINRIDTSICWNEQIAIGNQSFNATGNYTIKIPRQGNCDSVVLLSLTVYTAPVFEVKVDSQLVYSGSTVQLSVNPILQDVGYEWSPAGQVSDANSPSPTAQITEDIWFYVSITTDLGCVKTDSILVEIRKTACDIDEIYLPNAFTPNGDKKNDVYYVRSNVDFDEMKLTIFDRWGEMVFETIDQKNGWDGTINGKPALVDTYGYILEAKCSEETITRKGKIVLIR